MNAEVDLPEPPPEPDPEETCLQPEFAGSYHSISDWRFPSWISAAIRKRFPDCEAGLFALNVIRLAVSLIRMTSCPGGTPVAEIPVTFTDPGAPICKIVGVETF